jgi:quercetin dioxygenase-like cupin family protein
MKRSFTSRQFWSITLGILLLFIVCVVQAQQPAAPAQGQAPGQPAAQGQRGQQTPEQQALNAARVGNSKTMEAEGLLGQRRLFEAGSRTYWHSHDNGFITFVEKGRGRVQHRGEAMKELKPGEMDYTPPGVEHWHGATENESFTQIGVTFGGGIQWKEPVTDAQYQGKAK